MKPQTSLGFAGFVTASLVTLLLASCAQDFDSFVVPTGSGGAAANGGGGSTNGGATNGGGGSTNGGATNGGGGSTSGGATSGGATSGGAGGTGGTSCTPAEKLCDTSCQPKDVAHGCAETSCTACASLNGTPSCDGGACALACDAGYLDCDGSAGCEHNTRNDVNRCGGCSNDCAQQGRNGGFRCAVNGCECSARSQCGSSGSSACSNGICECGGTACARGEACNGSAQCSCNGGSACGGGETCCQTPKGCFDLQTDTSNCGYCGRACGAGQTCVAGECQ